MIHFWLILSFVGYSQNLQFSCASHIGWERYMSCRNRSSSDERSNLWDKCTDFLYKCLDLRTISSPFCSWKKFQKKLQISWLLLFMFQTEKFLSRDWRIIFLLVQELLQILKNSVFASALNCLLLSRNLFT